MPRQFYSPEERKSILDIVAKAKTGGSKWAEIHKRAQNGGFRGGLPALRVFVNRVNKKKRKPRAARLHPGVVAAAAATNAYNELQVLINRLVQERVNVALAKAVEALQGGISSGG